MHDDVGEELSSETSSLVVVNADHKFGSLPEKVE